jgi:hypothetical protein
VPALGGVSTRVSYSSFVCFCCLLGHSTSLGSSSLSVSPLTSLNHGLLGAQDFLNGLDGLVRLIGLVIFTKWNKCSYQPKV